ncbi:unnamed protein product, partial [Polarella glacialis]
LAVFAVSFVKRCRDFAQSAGVVHSAIWALAGVVVLQFAAQALHTVHLLEYRSNGRGLWPAELLSEVLCVVAQMVQTTLLNLIGMGYTIEDSAKLNWPKVAALIISSLGLHLALVFLSKLGAGAADNFHQHDGMAGWAMLALRLLLYAFFLHAVHGTGRNGGFRLQSFLGQFRLAGSLYFLGYPFLFLVSLPLAPYLRPILLTGGILTSQILSNLWLSSLFLSRGEYFKAKHFGIAGERLVFKRRASPKDGGANDHGGESSPGCRRLISFVMDCSGSMYRFNGDDGRLDRMLEDKFDFSIAGHSGDDPQINFVPFGKPPKDRGERLKLLQQMAAHTQFCMTGDTTIQATNMAVEGALRQLRHMQRADGHEAEKAGPSSWFSLMQTSGVIA